MVEPMKTAIFEFDNGAQFEIQWEVGDRIIVHSASFVGDSNKCNIWGFLNGHAQEDILYRISKVKPE
jgi:hypothetical protein